MPIWVIPSNVPVLHPTMLECAIFIRTPRENGHAKLVLLDFIAMQLKVQLFSMGHTSVQKAITAPMVQSMQNSTTVPEELSTTEQVCFIPYQVIFCICPN